MKWLSWPFAPAIAFLLGVPFLFGCSAVRSVCLTAEEVAAYEPFSPPQEIRILTINVWSGLTYKGTLTMGRYPDDLQKRYDALATEVRRLAPDIIAVQEANPLPHYARRLAADLDYRVVHRVALGGIRFGPVGIPWNLREGDAILVKKPWTVVELGRKRLGGWGITTNWFCFHFAEITQALLCRVVVNGKLLYVYNLHLHSGPFRGPALEEALQRLAQELPRENVREGRERVEEDLERRGREIANLREFIDETLPPGMPAIVLGDFNTTPESGEFEPLLADGRWMDSFRLVNPKDEGATWDPAHNPNFRRQTDASEPYDLLRAYHSSHSYRIDLVLVGGNIPHDRILSSRVVLTPADGVCASDHYGVLTTLWW